MIRSLKQEIRALEQHLGELAAQSDDELTERYLFKRSPRPKGLYWQLRGVVGSVLRWLQARWPWQPDPWPVSLKQNSGDPKSKPLLIWAVGANRETLREACTNLSERWGSFPGFAPVLITDVADFAFYSRLGWLVEYLPRLAGQGEPYEERKLKYLARLYRGAPVLPVSVGLQDSETVRTGPAASLWRVRSRSGR
jgi:hypothetical protein